MIRKFAHHLPHYLSLFAVLGAGFLGFALFGWDKAFQASIAVAMATAYVVWGIVHHAYHEDLYPQVLVEYLVVAALGLVLVLSTLFRV